MNFFKFSYWFSLYPPEMSNRAFYLSLAAFLIIFCLGIILKVLSKKLHLEIPYRRFLSRLGSPFIFFGFFALIFLGFKREMVYLLGARFWFLLFGLGTLVWIVYLLVRFLKTYKTDLAKIEKEKQIRKYLK